MAYPSFTVTNDFTNGTLADADEVNANFADIETFADGASAVGVPATIGISPIGSIVAWAKTLLEKSSTGSQTNTSTSATQLIDSAADFVSDGITAGMIVHNEDDNEFAIVETVVDLNTLTIVSDLNAGTADVDTFSLATGINYAIYATPELPDNWLECNGQSVSDSDSPFNGTTLPNMNGTGDSTKGFIRGVIGATDLTVTDPTHTHNVTVPSEFNHTGTGSSAYVGQDGTFSTTTSRAIPPYVEMVWIIRIK